MKKRYLFLISFLFLGLVSCNTTGNTDNTSGNSGQSSIDLGDIGNLPFSSKFIGDWNQPGLYEKDGSEHTMPETQKETGMEISVADYGAKANNPAADNYSAFKNAISNANSGDTIFVPNGTYYFSSGGNIVGGAYKANIIINKDNITFKGESKEGVILVSNFNEAANRDDSTTVIGAVNVKNVTIKNLTVTSNTSDDVLPDPDNSNLQTTTYTAPKYGITAASAGTISSAEKQARNILIENCMVEKFQRMGVRVAQAQEVVVRSCSFQKATCLGGGGMGYGVNIQGFGHDFNSTDTFVDARFNVVENCKFIGPYLRHGALIQYYAHNNVIRNNQFDDLLLDSIDMHGEDEYSNEIYENKVNNSRRGAGIGLGNTGATHDASGRNNYIHDNIITGGQRGIDVLLGTPDTIIYNNEIKNVSSTGIKCTNANGTNIIKNKLSNVASDAVTVMYSFVFSDPTLGIPNHYRISDNTFTSCNRGIYFDSKGSDFVVENNEFNDIDENLKIVDESADFVLPPKSTLMDPVEGIDVYPQENMFITMESQDQPAVYQKNLKLKTSNLEPLFNRIIYALWDKSTMPASYEHVYLCMTAKAQDGAPTINIFTNTTYTDWKTETIYWNNSKLHHETLALIKNTTEDPVTSFADFTFPIVEYEFHTYYLDVTEAFKTLPNGLFTMVFTNESIDESYMEIYSNQQANNQGLRFIFS